MCPLETINDRPLDWKGLILIGLGLPLIFYGATEIGSNKTNLFTFLAVGIGVVLASSFILSSIKIKNSLIDLTLLKRGGFAAATFTTGITGANMYGGLLLLPLYLQLTAGQDVLETGFMLLAMGLGTAGALYFGGMLTDYYRAGPVTVAGAILLVITTIPFVFIAKFSLTMLVLLLVIRGIGLALAQMPAYTAAYASVTDEQMGDAATVVNITQRIGGAIGAVGLVIIIAQFSGRNSLDAYTWAFGVLTLISVFIIISGALIEIYEKKEAVDHATKAHVAYIEKSG